MDFDYKKYSLQRLEEWLHDALSSSEATPQEIYDAIKGVVDENYHIYKNHTERCYELLALLNGNGIGHLHISNEDKTNPWYDYFTDPAGNQVKVCDKDDLSAECKNSWNRFWQDGVIEEDKVVKWQLPVEVDNAAGDAEPIYYVNFPDDLLEAANLKEGDTIEWVDNNDGSYTLRKTNAV